MRQPLILKQKQQNKLVDIGKRSVWWTIQQCSRFKGGDIPGTGVSIGVDRLVICNDAVRSTQITQQINQ